MSATQTENVTAVSRLSALSQQLRGSEILRIAAEVRDFAAAGNELVNLTVGDFSPREFRIPKELQNGIVEALRAGESNYPPSNGLDALRAAVQAFYQRQLGRRFGVEQILITAGARPAIYTVYRALVDPGDRVVYTAPSWNNDSYCDLVGAEPVTVDCDAQTKFLPTADILGPLIRGARLR